MLGSAVIRVFVARVLLGLLQASLLSKLLVILCLPNFHLHELVIFIRVEKEFDQLLIKLHHAGIVDFHRLVKQCTASIVLLLNLILLVVDHVDIKDLLSVQSALQVTDRIVFSARLMDIIKVVKEL